MFLELLCQLSVQDTPKIHEHHSQNDAYVEKGVEISKIVLWLQRKLHFEGPRGLEFPSKSNIVVIETIKPFKPVLTREREAR